MHTAERVTLARLPSGVPVTTTVHTYDGGDGPRLYVQAAQHGREVNGEEVLRRLHGRLREAGDDLSGTVVAVPVADPLTFDRVSYTAPESLDSVNPNMNRCWPGDPEGTLHERMAARLWERVEGADAAVDLHTGSPEMLTHAVYLAGDERSRALAEAFGTDLLLAEAAGDAADVEWEERDFDGKFRVAATRAGVPTITPELAHSRQLIEPAIEAGVDGMLGVLRHLEVLPEEERYGGGADPGDPSDRTVARDHLGRVRATDSGLFVPADGLELGARVESGTYLGTVYDPTTYDALQRAETDREGVLYSVAREATVTAGETLAGVALVLEGRE